MHIANTYQRCEMYTEAINTYQTIIKNKVFDQAARLRVNIGNIYFIKGKYLQAVKMYRMALDQIQNTQQQLK